MTPKEKTHAASEAYQLKITLDDIRPPIWRRIQVPASITLNQLHEVIQEAMGWSGYHLHLFEIGHGTYTAPGVGEDRDDVGTEDEDDAEYSFQDVINSPRQKFRYTYDFGDGWDHTIEVEKILPAASAGKDPICLAGKRACPPEDCGGPWGYTELLEALRDPHHERHEELTEWAGSDFDPEAFSLQDVNARLRDVLRPRRKRSRAH